MRKITNAELGRPTVEEFSHMEKMPVAVVLDNVRSAQNVGAFFRTGDAFAVTKICLCGITAVPPSREIHKSSLGAEFSVAWEHYPTTEECLARLHDEGYRIVAVEQVEGSVSLDELRPDPSCRYALVFGNEVLGVGQQATVYLEESGDQLAGIVTAKTSGSTVTELGNMVGYVTIEFDNPGVLSEGVSVTAVAGSVACAQAGQASYADSVEVTAGASGTVTGLSLRQGDAAEQGELLFTLENSSLLVSSQSSALSLENAEISLADSYDALNDYNITARLDSYDLTADITAAPGFVTLNDPENAQAVRVRETVQWGAANLPADRFSEEQQELSAQASAANAAMGLLPAVNEDGSLAMSPYLIVLSDEEYAALAGADAASDGQTLDCILVNRYLYTGSEGGYTDVRGQTSFQPGDTIDWDFNTLPVTLNIQSVLDGDDVPEELVRTIPSATTITFVTGRSAADAVFARFTAETGGYCRRNFTFSYQAQDRDALMDELGALSFGTNYYSATDLTAELASLSSAMTLVRVALYGFTALIALVCAANIANTVSSGMALRRRESAVLRSVGMTPQSLRRMIFWESGIYGLKALCWGLPVSGVLLWFVWRKLTNLYVFPFSLPWGVAVLAGAAMLILCLLSAWPALARAGRTAPAADLQRED